MPALKPLPSPARLAANRANARRSTGPKTEAGKARSRRNSTVHGLTGAGVALPIEDEAAIAAQFAAVERELAPATAMGSYFARRVALAMVRTERAARHEAKALAHRVRHAADAFDRDRTAAADAALARLRSGDDRGARHDLRQTPEGIDRLRGELAALRESLTLPEPLWSRQHGLRLDACLGVAADPVLPSRGEVLTTTTLTGAVDLLTRRDLAAIAEARVAAPIYALCQIVALIDGELAALGDDRAALDPAVVDLDRAEAAERALFDPSPAAQLARRYEAAAVRDLARSLRLFREVEAQTNEVEAEVEAPSPAEPTANPGPPPLKPINIATTVGPKSAPGEALPRDLASFGAFPPVGESRAGGWAAAPPTTVLCAAGRIGLE